MRSSLRLAGVDDAPDLRLRTAIRFSLQFALHLDWRNACYEKMHTRSHTYSVYTRKTLLLYRYVCVSKVRLRLN